MTETEHLKEAIAERDIAAKELIKMTRHLMLCDEVIAKARRRLEKSEFRVSMSLEDVGEMKQRTL